MATHTDDLLRSVEQAASVAGPPIAAVANMNDSDLFSALGDLTEAPRPGRQQNPSSSSDIDDLRRGTEAEALGRRIFHRWNVALHQFVCTPAKEDQAVREKLFEALTGRSGTAVAFIAGVLVASFAVSPAVAAIVATLLVRLLINPTTDELCKYWSERIRP